MGMDCYGIVIKKFKNMETTTIINRKKTALYIGYAMDGADEFFSSFEDLLKYWTPYYKSRAELMEKGRFTAVVETESGFPLYSERVMGAITSAQKKAIAEKAAEANYGLYTIEEV
jgi:hypothetical protein